MEPLIKNIGSVFYLVTLTKLYRFLTTNNGLKQLLNSKLIKEAELGEILLKYDTTSKLWKSKIASWFRKRNDKYDLPEAIRDRPKNIEHFSTHRFNVTKAGKHLQADLMEMRWNNPDKHRYRYAYVLVLVDMFSEKLFLFPARTKKAKEIANLFVRFFSDNPTYQFLQCDKGGEFEGEVNDVFKTFKIHKYHTDTMQKAYLAERKIRDIKFNLNRIKREGLEPELIERFTKTSKYNKNDWTVYIDFVAAYLNNEKNSRLQYTPNELHFPNLDEITDQEKKTRIKLRQLLAHGFWVKSKLSKFNSTYVKQPQINPNKKMDRRILKIGEKVYLSKDRVKGTLMSNPFTKVTQRGSYWDRDDIYIVHKIIKGLPPQPFDMYILKRVKDNIIMRPKFYRRELRVVPNNATDNFFETKRQYSAFLKNQKKIYDFR